MEDRENNVLRLWVHVTTFVHFCKEPECESLVSPAPLLARCLSSPKTLWMQSLFFVIAIAKEASSSSLVARATSMAIDRVSDVVCLNISLVNPLPFFVFLQLVGSWWVSSTAESLAAFSASPRVLRTCIQALLSAGSASQGGKEW